jgi:hypothetical protein
MYSPSMFDVVDSLAQADHAYEGEGESFVRAAREAARARRAQRRHLLPARLRVHGIVRPALISALIAGAFAFGHAL